MLKILRCDDVVPGCDALIEGKDEVEVTLKAREHATTDHRLPYLTAGLTMLIQQAIRDEMPGPDEAMQARGSGQPSPADPLRARASRIQAVGRRARDRRALLLACCDADADRLRKLFGNEPEVLVTPLTDAGQIPADLPALDRVVLLTHWSRLALQPLLVDRWRRTLAPAPLAVFIQARRSELEEALRFASGREVCDLLEVPLHLGYLRHKIHTAFQRLAEEQGTRRLREQLIEQGADFREFVRVALELAAEADRNHLLELIVTKCREVTCADAGSLYLVDDAPRRPEPSTEVERILRFVVAQNDSKRLELTSVHLPLNRASIAGYVALTRTPVNFPDVYDLPPGVEFSFNPQMDAMLRYRTISMLAVPMIGLANEVIGVVQIINRKRAAIIRLNTPEAAIAEALPFGARELGMVTSLANLAAVVTAKGRRAEHT